MLLVVPPVYPGSKAVVLVAVEVHLADRRGGVALPAQVLGDGRGRVGECRSKERDAGCVRITARQEGLAGRSAHRGIGVGTVEAYPLGGQLVEVRRAGNLTAVGPRRVGGVVVRHDDDHVLGVKGIGRTRGPAVLSPMGELSPRGEKKRKEKQPKHPEGDHCRWREAERGGEKGDGNAALRRQRQGRRYDIARSRLPSL